MYFFLMLKQNKSSEKNDKKPEERRGVVVSVDSLITDFFREIYLHNPIDGSKIIFK